MSLCWIAAATVLRGATLKTFLQPLYNHQIPPGAGQTVHYALHVPDWVDQPIVIEAALKYRKFDKGYIDFMNASRKEGDNEFRNQGPPGSTANNLPAVVMCSESRRLAGQAQRWHAGRRARVRQCPTQSSTCLGTLE